MSVEAPLRRQRAACVPSPRGGSGPARFQRSSSGNARAHRQEAVRLTGGGTLAKTLEDRSARLGRGPCSPQRFVTPVGASGSSSGASCPGSPVAEAPRSSPAASTTRGRSTSPPATACCSIAEAGKGGPDCQPDPMDPTSQFCVGDTGAVSTVSCRSSAANRRHLTLVQRPALRRRPRRLVRRGCRRRVGPHLGRHQEHRHVLPARRTPGTPAG